MTSAWIDETGQCSSPAASALAAVLRTFVGSKRVICRRERGGDDCYRICSYREDFNYLWHLGRRLERGLFAGGRRCTFIIVWDGVPPTLHGSLVHTDRYLTPLDWAVGFSLAAQRLGAEGPDFRILILDLASGRLAEAESVRYFAQFPQRGPQAMPWIRVFRPVGDERDDGRRAEPEGDLDLLPLAILADLHERRFSFFGGHPETLRNSFLATIGRIWAASLAQPAEPGDHHALANLVGPLLLRLSGTGDSRARALHALLKHVGLVPQTAEKQPLLAKNNPWVVWNAETWKTAIQRILERGDDAKQDTQPLRFLLVDDNAFQTGWAELVCMALGAERTQAIPAEGQPAFVGKQDQEQLPFEVYAVESAEQLVPAQAAPVAGQRFHFACHLPNRGGQGADLPIDVLLLDLRLHQGKTLAVEAGYFQRLLKKAEEFCLDDRDEELAVSLPWPGFARTELDLMGDWVREALAGNPTACREDPRYHRALALLPRLISLMDCSLPIVLFSSTGRREILEFLKPYGNIITAFEKPRLAAIPDPSIAGHTAEKFRNAILASLHLVAARRMCRGLPTASSRTFNPATTTRTTEPSNQVWKIELMLDEEGNANPTLTVGGVLAVYPPAVSPKEFDAELGRTHSQIGADKNYSHRRREMIAEDLDKLCEKFKVFVAAVSVAGQLSDTLFPRLDDSDDLHHERVADNLHRQLFRYLVESAIYYSARHCVPSGVKATFTVRAATRHVPFRHTPTAKRLEKALFSDWGLAAEYIGPNEDLWNAKEKISRWLRYADKTNPLRKAAQELADALGKIMKDPVIPKNSKPDWSARHFRLDSPRPFVEEIMGHYEGSLFCPKPDIVRAFPLNTHGRGAADYIPLLHFFADGLLAKNGTTGSSLDRLWDNGFRANYGPDLAKAIESHRSLLRGFLAEALTAYASLNTGARSDKLICGIGSDLHTEVAAISGAEFLRFSRQLQELALPSGPRIELLEGEVFRCRGDAGLDIRDASGREFWAFKEDCEGPWGHFRRGTKVAFVGTPGTAPGTLAAREVRRKTKGDPIKADHATPPTSSPTSVCTQDLRSNKPARQITKRVEAPRPSKRAAGAAGRSSSAPGVDVTVGGRARHECYLLSGCPVPHDGDLSEIDKAIRMAGLAGGVISKDGQLYINANPVSEGTVLNRVLITGLDICGRKVRLRAVPVV